MEDNKKLKIYIYINRIEERAMCRVIPFIGFDKFYKCI